MKKTKPGPRSPALSSTLHRVMERRGTQRFFYHVHETTVSHWWDHEDLLNTVQYDLEVVFGPELVQLVALREFPHAGKDLVFCFYFRIGPLPWPDIPFPVVQEKTVIVGVHPAAESRL